MPREACEFCGTRTGIHGFAFDPDGKYTSEAKEVIALEESDELYAASLRKTYTD